jgi:hypothetical protein
MNKPYRARRSDMRFKIHFTVNGYEDFIILEGDSVESIREQARYFFASRNIDEEKCNPWSEEENDD